MKKPRIPAARLRSNLETTLEELGRTPRDRLEKVIRIFEGQAEAQVPLSQCLQALFGESEDLQKALSQLRQFRNQVNAVAKDQGNIEFCVDTNLQAKPDDRRIWFIGPDTTVKAIEDFSESGAHDGVDNFVPTRLRIMKGEKRVILLFRSYANDESNLANELMQTLENQYLKNSIKFHYELWDDTGIKHGEEWLESIQAAMQTHEFGLMLVSPAFFASKFIRDVEIPHFLGRDAVLPVALAPFNPRLVQTHGLDARQIFFAKIGDRHQVSFEECESVVEKRQFVSQLFEFMESALEDLPTDGDSIQWDEVDEKEKITLLRQICDRGELGDREHFFAALASDGQAKTVIPARAMQFALREMERLDQKRFGQDAGVDALSFLREWVIQNGGAPFCAVLGEYGIGKTTTLKKLTRDLLAERRAGNTVPLPIFVDLRYYQRNLENTDVPTLDDILTEVIKRNWKQGQRPSLTAADLSRMVREEGALIIFDGLDEKIVHLQPSQKGAFIRELWRILPPVRERGTNSLEGKVIISCRSHYFKDVLSQNAMLTGEGREDISPDQYRACIMLPFNEEQVRQYLTVVLGSDRVEPTLETFRAVHNLSELAERPYLLDMMLDHLKELEEMRATGKTVRGVTLYELLVEKWLLRDSGKHQFTEAHKQELMENLAAELWKEGVREWPWRKVETWLGQFLASHSEMKETYSHKKREVLNEDLRTATFILREGTSKDRFQFAHTSLLEFFLARHLVRRLECGDYVAWKLPEPSWEVIDFVAQLLDVTEDDTAMERLAYLLEKQHCKATRLAFSVWLRGAQDGYRIATPRKVDIHGEDLSRWIIAGRLESPLDLQFADFTGCSLNQSRFEYANLNGANFSRVDATGCEFSCVEARQICFQEACLAGSTWRDADLSRSDCDHELDAHWVRTEGRRIALPSYPLVEYTGGHPNGLTSAVFSPDGNQLATTSRDGTARLWNVTSGRELLRLEGHGSQVTAAAFALNGGRLATASMDRTARVWDLCSGQELIRLEGHSATITAVVFSNDGERLATASWDKTAFVWDLKNQRILLRLEGHEKGITSAVFSPDGTKLATASQDKTARLWDLNSGHELFRLEGHQNALTSVAISPDGSRLATASWDRTARLWDLNSGRELLRLEGNENQIVTAAFSPEGTRLATGFGDGSARIWDLSNRQEVLRLDGHTTGVIATSFSPDGTRLATASRGGTTRLWELSSGRELLRLEGQADWLTSAAFSPIGNCLVTTSAGGGGHLWDLDILREVHRLEGHSDGITAAAFSPGGSRLATASYDMTARIWDLASSRELTRIGGHTSWLTAVAFSFDGNQLATGSADDTARIWEVDTGREVLRLTGHGDEVTATAFSPNGSQLVTASRDGTARIWDLLSGRESLRLVGHKFPLSSAVFSPDGNSVATASWDNTARVWSVDSGKEDLCLIGHTDWLTSITFSSDGTRLATTSYDKTARVWDLTSGRELQRLEEHGNWVNAAAFSPDGTRLATASGDGTVRIWNLADRKFDTMIFHSKDGETAVISHTDHRILWASPGSWRYLGWWGWDPERKAMRTWPAETFGPLPGPGQEHLPPVGPP